MSDAEPRICVPIKVRPEGGLYTFVGILLTWLARNNHQFTQDLGSEYDVLLVNSWVIPPGVVRRQKQMRPRLRVVHRIDGSATDYGSDPASDAIQARVNLYSDLTIFQSAYSRFSTCDKFRVIAQDGPVIYNPVDIDQFTPSGPMLELPMDGPRVVCASWSVNPKKGAALLEALVVRNPGVTFVLCGRFDGVASHANVVRLGHLTREDMARALRSCDAFLNVSENESCPNVVIEALASGLPVLYLDSGGVPELVGPCGAPIGPESFAAQLNAVLASRESLSQAARRRAETMFAANRVLAQYWEVICSSTRRPLPNALHSLRLAAEGYPLMPRVRSTRQVIDGLRRRAPRVFSTSQSRRADGRRVGWITYDSFPGRKRRFRDLDSFTGMRVGNVVRWLERHDADLRHELYQPEQRYDAVVFQKVMDPRAQAEAEKIRAAGGRVIFDANVNYYEEWGDYFVAGTRPTEQQRRDAIRMTTLADQVIADSSYLLSVVEPLNARAVWIPDNVDLDVYEGPRTHHAGENLRLIWCGVGKKATHLLAIADALSRLHAAELLVVADERPVIMSELERLLPCRWLAFSDRAYARALAASDVIISPKRLVNAYEVAHTEYKITLGMAVGLPAVAHPQRSYQEAIHHGGGGLICETTDEWLSAFEYLRDPAIRNSLGAHARRTVVERYSTPVVAAEYRRVLHQTLAMSLDPAPVNR